MEIDWENCLSVVGLTVFKLRTITFSSAKCLAEFTVKLRFKIIWIEHTNDRSIAGIEQLEAIGSGCDCHRHSHHHTCNSKRVIHVDDHYYVLTVREASAQWSISDDRRHTHTRRAVHQCATWDRPSARQRDWINSRSSFGRIDRDQTSGSLTITRPTTSAPIAVERRQQRSDWCWHTPLRHTHMHTLTRASWRAMRWGPTRCARPTF